jgi:acyl dehydratase
LDYLAVEAEAAGPVELSGGAGHCISSSLKESLNTAATVPEIGAKADRPAFACEGKDMPEDLYLEDFFVGQIFKGGCTVTIQSEQIKAFAAQFDPQPFHLDETVAAASFFGGLVASGWHTAALTMRMIVASEIRIPGGLIGAGAEELKWPRPVRPGDALHIVSEVIEVRPSKSRPGQGIVKMRTQTMNQEDQLVMSLVANLIVPRRPL